MRGAAPRFGLIALLVSVAAALLAQGETGSGAATGTTGETIVAQPVEEPLDASGQAADDAALAAALAATEAAVKAAAQTQAADEEAEAAAEKAGVASENELEAVVPVGAEPVDVTPPLIAPGAPAPAPLVPEAGPPTTALPAPAPPARARPRAPRPPADPLESLAKDATATEIEAVLAQAPKTYLVIDARRSTLSVRARGLTLDEVAVQGVHLLYSTGLFGAGSLPALAAPAVWRVAEIPDGAVRELIAPASLRPYVPEEEREEAEAGAQDDEQDEEPQPPASYRIKMNSPWDLAVVDRLPRRHLLRRFLDAARSGWAEVLGKPLEQPPTVAITVAADDARRIHHLFRVDTAVLLTAK
jgi:hypothetical protein